MDGAAAMPLGPGRLVLVVGPSGAGKDTLIGAVRDALAGDPSVVFPRRVVTRPSSAAEDNVEADAEGFARLAAEGAFVLSWTAHGHAYGIPATIDAAIAAGRTVVCNVSREIIAEARRRYRNVTVVEITASPEVLAARITARSRPSDGDPVARAARKVSAPVVADVAVVNDGAVAQAAEQLRAAISGRVGQPVR
jgi:ribose 1,5-bisphosphokinase